MSLKKTLERWNKVDLCVWLLVPIKKKTLLINVRWSFIFRKFMELGNGGLYINHFYFTQMSVEIHILYLHWMKCELSQWSIRKCLKGKSDQTFPLSWYSLIWCEQCRLLGKILSQRFRVLYLWQLAITTLPLSSGEANPLHIPFLRPSTRVEAVLWVK